MADPPHRSGMAAAARFRSILPLLLSLLLLCVLSLAALPASASIHRHANYTLYPCKQNGAPDPAQQFERFRPKRPHKPRPKPTTSTQTETDSEGSTGAAARRLLHAFPRLSASPPGPLHPRRFTSADAAETSTGASSDEDPIVFDDPDAAIDPPSDSSDPDADASTDPWSRLHEAEARAQLDELLRWREVAPIENLPWATSTTLEEDEARAFTNVSGIELDRRLNASRAPAEVSVTKLSLWNAFSPDSQDAPLQHGHLIVLSNPANHFAFMPPRGGCAETANRGGLEKVASNAQRNRCRVATNAGFFNVAVPRGFERRPGEFTQQCFGALIAKGGEFVQKQHSNLLSRQFKRNVHFGITSHAHFFVGYLTNQMWETHLKEGSKLPADVDDVTPPKQEQEPGLSSKGQRVHPLEAASSESTQQPSFETSQSSRVDPVTGRSYTVRHLGKSAASLSSTAASLSSAAPDVAAANVSFVPLSPPLGWHFSTLISGLLWLVRDGRDYVLESTLHDQEDFGPETAWCQGQEAAACKDDPSHFRWREHFIHLQSARTAIGHTASGELIILQIDGKSHDATVFPEQTARDGVNLHDMARLLIKLGAINAINLDGGGSATTVVEGVVSNYPTDGITKPKPGLDEYTVVDRKVSTITCIYDGDDEQGSQPLQPVVIHPAVNITLNSTSVIIINATLAINSTAVQAEDGLAVHPKTTVDGESAEIADLRSQVFRYSVLLPLLLVCVLFLSLVLLYFLCAHRHLRKGFQRLGEDAANATAASSSRAMRSSAGNASEMDVERSEIDAAAAVAATSSDPELGDVNSSDLSRPSPSSVSVLRNPLPPFASPSHHSAFASSSLESRENLSLDGQRAAIDTAEDSAGHATSLTDRRLQRETAAQRKQTQSDRKKLNSSKYGGVAESVGGLLASTSPSPPPAASSKDPAAVSARFEIGAEEDDLFEDEEEEL